MVLHQARKLLHSEGNHQQNEKAIYWMGKKIFTNDILDKGLISTEHTHSNKKETIQ